MLRKRRTSGEVLTCVIFYLAQFYHGVLVVQTGKDFYFFFLDGSQLEFEREERKSRFTLPQLDVEEILV